MANLKKWGMAYYPNEVTVYLEVFNEAHRLSKCLKSFQWASELVVFVKKSHDNTLEIAKKFATHVYPVKFTEAGSSLDNYNLHSGKCWSLFITASDLIEPDLAEEVVNATNKIENTKVAFALNYRIHVLGRSGRESPWFLNRKVCLIHRNQVKLSKTLHREVGYKNDTLIIPLGKTNLGALHHFTHPTPNSLFKKHLRYTEFEAHQLYSNCTEKDAVRIVLNEVFRSIARVILRRNTIFRGKWGFLLSLIYISYFIMKLAQVLHLFKSSDNPYELLQNEILDKWRK